MAGRIRLGINRIFGVFCVRMSFGELIPNLLQSGMNLQTCLEFFFGHTLCSDNLRGRHQGEIGHAKIC